MANNLLKRRRASSEELTKLVATYIDYYGVSKNLYSNQLLDLSVYSYGNLKGYSISQGDISQCVSITLTSNVVRIDDYAFCDIDFLNNISLSRNIKSIGLFAFARNRRLTTINGLDGLSDCSFGGGVFAGDKSLVQINLPQCVKTLGAADYMGYINGFFDLCTNLVTVNAPGITHIQEDALDGCLNLLYIFAPNVIHIDSNSGLEDTLYYKNKLDYVILGKVFYKLYNNQVFNGFDSNIKVIQEYAFMSCDNLNTITIPSTILEIGDHAFTGCKNLLSVNIEYNPTTDPNKLVIGEDIFNLCSSLTTVNVTNPVISLRNYGEYFRLKITTVNTYINDNYYLLTDAYIPEEYIKDFTNVTSANIPSGIVNILSKAFWHCDSLENLQLPNTVYSIAPDSFGYCGTLQSCVFNDENYLYHSLYNAIIKKSIGKTGSSIIRGCAYSQINNIEVQKIDNYAFSGAKGRDFNINSVTEVIGEEAFAESDLKSIMFAGILLKKACYNCQNLTSVYISYLNNKQNKIQDSVFENCTNLQTVTLLEGITEVNWNAFKNCTSLESITFPASLNRIGNSISSIPYSLQADSGVLYGCTNLLYIKFLNTTPPVLESIGEPFGNTNDCPIYVPAESVDLYKSANVWIRYASRIQAIPSE